MYLKETLINLNKNCNNIKQFKQTIMKDLISFKNAQIEALQREVDLLKKSNTQLETYVFELTDEDVPKEYKSVVRQEILK